MDIDAKDIPAPTLQSKEFALSYFVEGDSTAWALGEDTSTDEVSVILSGVSEGKDAAQLKLAAVLVAIEHIQSREDYSGLKAITLYVYSSKTRVALFELGSMFGKIYVAARSAMTHGAQWSRPCVSQCRVLLGLPEFPTMQNIAAGSVKSKTAVCKPIKLTIATDGSVCGGRGGGGSFGWVAEDGTYGLGPVDTADILVAEIQAIAAALAHTDLNTHVRILTDSKPAIAHIQRSAVDISGVGNTRRVTKALRLLHERMARHASVDIVWVRAHDGNALNEGADRLARMARQTKAGVSASTRAEIAKNIVDDVIAILHRKAA